MQLSSFPLTLLASPTYSDPRFKRILWDLICCTRGGVNRARIIEMLISQPANPNQVATKLRIDYKTVMHHLRVLTDNGLLITDKECYGAVYFLTPVMELNIQSLVEILAKVKRGI